MSEPELEVIKLGDPPQTPETSSYYYIYGEWEQFYQPSTIATADNPNPDNRVIKQKYGLNEAIAMHPAIFVVLIQDQRPGYACKAWSRISPELGAWCLDFQKRKNEAIQAAMKKQQG